VTHSRQVKLAWSKVSKQNGIILFIFSASGNVNNLCVFYKVLCNFGSFDILE